MNCCIGIDLTADAIRLVQIARRRGRLFVLGTDTRSLTPNGLPQGADEISALLSDAIRQAGFKRNAKVVVGLPYEKVFFHSFRTNLSTREDVRRLSRFELEDDFPVPFDDLVVDICGHRCADGDDHEYLVAAMAREQLDLWGRVCEASRWKGPVLSTDVCALATLAHLPGPQEEDVTSLLLYADGHRMVLGLLQQGSLVCARHRSCEGDVQTMASTLANDIELTLRATLGSRHSLPVKVLASGPEDLVAELSDRLLQKTGRAIQPVELASLIQKSPGAEFDGGLSVAL